jgi:hypothetical protein
MSSFEDSQSRLLFGYPELFETSIPRRIFHEETVELLSNISAILLKSKEAKEYPDLISFAFWCRNSSIYQLSRKYVGTSNRIGLGTVLHITPKNVPMNFAFSWALSSLAGNRNLVKLPTNDFKQVEFFLNTLLNLSNEKRFANTLSSNLFFKTERSSGLLRQLTLSSEARMLWGHSETIKYFRSFEVNPRHIDFAFPSRYSVALLSSKIFLESTSGERNIIAQKFIKDALTFGQRGCSSPRIVFWLGESHLSDLARQDFWDLVSNLVPRYLENSDYFARFANLAQSALRGLINPDLNLDFQKTLVNFQSQSPLMNGLEQVLSLGTFQEIKVDSPREFLSFLDRSVQTVTYFGIDPELLLEAIIEYGISGVDRIVPLGSAFDFSPIWDGVDLVSALSRVVEIR